MAVLCPPPALSHTVMSCIPRPHSYTQHTITHRHTQQGQKEKGRGREKEGEEGERGRERERTGVGDKLDRILRFHIITVDKLVRACSLGFGAH